MATTILNLNRYDPQPVSREQAAAEFASFPAHLGRYGDAVAAWQARGGVQVPDQLIAAALSVYHIIRRYDVAWSTDVRNGLIPMDWEESRRLCRVYGEWRQFSVPLARALGPQAVKGEPEETAAFRDAFLRASFNAKTDIDRLRAANEQAERWLAEPTKRKSDAVGR
jgi:hypothetical protein